MDIWQARIETMKGSERVRSLPFMVSKPSGQEVRWRTSCPEGHWRGLRV